MQCMYVTTVLPLQQEMKPYGPELILDLHNCDPTTFTRRSLKAYFKKVCELTNMERSKLCWWDDYWVPWFWKETEPHIKGTTAVQFIRTSNITIHTLEIQKAVRLNIFTCKPFDPVIVEAYTLDHFGGKVVNRYFIQRF